MDPSSSRKTMKRRRPWGSCSVVAAAAILIGLCHGSNGLPIDLIPNIAAPTPPEETDVTGYPSPPPTPSPVQPIAPVAPPSSPPPPTLSPTELPKSTETKSPIATSSSSIVMTKESFPVNVDMVLNITSTADINEVAGDVQNVVENHLLDGLTSLKDEGITTRSIALTASVVVRRLLRRVQQQQATREVTVEVDGTVQYDSISEDHESQFNSELESLLAADSLNEAFVEAEVEGVLAVKESKIVEDRETDPNGENLGNSDDPRSPSNGEPSQAQGNGRNGETLERPSTLSIVFGFMLTVIAAAGLVAYAYIFYRKSKKRLARQKQIKESIQYHMPNKFSPTKRQQPPPTTPLPVKNPAVTVSAKESDDSEGSSYKGIDSVESGDEPTDTFARELQVAASLDQQAWEDFQRKKHTLDHSGTQGQHGAQDESGGAHWAKSFPYGDEEQTTFESGVEWTADDMDDISNWEPYRQKGGSSRAAEEKKDEHGIELFGQDTKSASMATGAALQSIEQNLKMFGTSNDEPDSTDNVSEIVSEVERLSRFVKRYDKRKERRIQREKSILNKSGDQSFARNHGSTENDPQQLENISHLNNVQYNRQAEEISKPVGFGQIGHSTPRMTTFTGLVKDASLSALNAQNFQISDDESESEHTEDRSILSQRLGITPFKVQKPQERESPDVNTMSPRRQREITAEADTGNGMSRFMFGVRERPQQREQPQQQEQKKQKGRMNSFGFGTKSGLSALRSNDAIIDSSKSDVNVGTRAPVDVLRQQNGPNPTMTSPIQPAREPSPNKKFNKLFHMFEEKKNEAIFPPDQHWQYGISGTPKSNASTPRTPR